MNGAARTLVLLALLGACDDETDSKVKSAPPSTLDGGAELVSATLCPKSVPQCGSTSLPSYKSEIAPLVALRCGGGGCHSGKVGEPWPLDSYDNLADWSSSLSTDLEDCTMPPADAGVPFSVVERERLLTWLRCGTPDN
ncbi:MAG: hypothetical protein JWN48_4730 [Myxococcaceae bacterium]|nr:hypothetical protein [Myxococcaceae bacterium]